MKLHTKYMLSFMLVILVMMGLLSVYVNTVLTQRMQEEKSNGYRVYLQQLVRSTELITKEIEQSLFNQYNDSQIASELLSATPTWGKRQSIEYELTSIPLNNANIASVLVLDTNENLYFATSVLDERSTIFENVLTQRIDAAFTLWLRDDAGYIFVKKDILRPSPMKYAGVILARMKTPKLLSALGLNAQTDGLVALINEQGNVIAAQGSAPDGVLELAMQANPLGYKPVETTLTINGVEYYLSIQPGKNRAWYALQLVPVSAMLAMPISLSRLIWMGSAFVILCALLVGYVITRSMSRNVMALLASIAEVSRGNFETSIPVHTSDEIGELADQFRWMQNELKNVTAQMVQRATEKQSAEYEMLELKYRSLQAQISPHFICNVLSTVDALNAMGHIQEVSRLSVKASRYLRDNLRLSDRKFTSLDQEVRFVKEYVELYYDIYRSPYQLNTTLCDDTDECEVPTMLLQPLVENAMVHGFPLDEPDKVHLICIHAEIVGTRLVIQVSDDGQGISPEIIAMVERAEADREFNKKMSGFGLRGVLQRLRLLYGSEQSLQIRSVPNVQTILTIQIPQRYYHEE